MIRRGREQPALEVADQLLVPLGLLLLREAFEVGVTEKFVGKGAIGAKKEMRGLLESGLAVRVHQARPPVIPWEIPSGEGEFLEVILEQKPGALRISAGGELIQKFGAFRNGGFGIGEFASQVRLRAVRAAQHVVMGIVPRSGSR
jgi:hypothetical protein